MINKSPLIICGMHRSGTMLLSRILKDVGVYIGSDLDSHLESKKFQKLNQELLSQINSRWDQANNFKEILNLNNSLNGAQILKNTYNEISSFNSKLRYLRFEYLKACYKAKSFIWGWKDPRNTITFPIWLDLFPDAKIIYIYRNGLDVALSLSKREIALSKELRINSQLSNWHSKECMDLNYSFNLWEKYCEFFEGNINRVSNNNLLKLKFEDLVSNPKIEIDKLQNFIKIKYKKELDLDYIDQSKSNNFKSCKEALVFYKDEARNSAMMRKLGYC